MTNFTVKVRADEGNVGSNKIEVFLDTEPKQEIMILTDRMDDFDEDNDDGYGDESQNKALYYAVERIVQLERYAKVSIARLEEQAEALAKLVEHSINDGCSSERYKEIAGQVLNAYMESKGYD